MNNKTIFESKKAKMALIGVAVEALLAFIMALARSYDIEIPPEVLAYVAGIFGVAIGGQATQDAMLARNHKPEIQPPKVSIPVFTEASEIPKEEMNIPPISDAVAEFELIWKQRGNYILLNPDNPQQVEVDYLQPYAEALQASRRMWRQLRGEEAPIGIDPCECGDKSYEARWLRFARSELAIQQSMVEAIKRSKPMLNYQLGGVGYLLNGIKWELIPDWAKQNLEEHISKEVKK